MDNTTYTNLDATIWLTYATPSYFLYILELLVINVHRFGRLKFKGSFYKIYSINAIFQVISNLAYYISHRGGLAPMFMSLYTVGFSFWSVFITWLSYYATFYVLIGNLLMTLNRFTIFILKHRYVSFWNKYLLPLLILTWLLPCCLTWHLFLTRVSVVYEDGNGYQLFNTMKLSYWSSSRSGTTVFLATAPLALGLNIYICRQIMIQRKHKTDDSRTNKTDIQLFIVTIITFVVQSCFNGIQFLFLIPNLQSLGLYLLAAQRYANDAATLLPAWTMIIMNRELRRGIMNLLFGVCTKRYKEERGSTVVVSRVVITVPDSSRHTE